MEKEPNKNSMNGTATMPSYFPCIKSSESHPLADWLYLKSVITSSPEFRMMTETYRKRLAISKQFADRIDVENLPDNKHTQSLFRYFFKKWLVAMVVVWVRLKVVNQMILIFVGKGGIFKTTFFHMLLPPQLRQYFLNDSTGAYTDKDFIEAFSSKAMICLDEFETVFGKNLSAFKSNLTKLTFSIRRPYDKYRSELPHRGAAWHIHDRQPCSSDYRSGHQPEAQCRICGQGFL